ncbi:amidohydrolase family protein [Anaerotruncus rubiinfantis]|uniref:amidohydrolase family protein n=1 Tax=Anaerotruncus rubiinfantis TaxID=1720200 RepID=UPI00189B9F67|nr:amidohydrolase family protein [Anaerotruncus rubiinfantis]
MKSGASFAVKGAILHSASKDEIRCLPDGYLICENGLVAGVFRVLPEKYAGIRVVDHTGKLVIPGLCDLHLHAPQYAFRGLGMDLELLDWLDARVFPEEAKFDCLAYAGKAYGIFADALKESATTRACIFATIHTPATLLLMELLENAGLHALVGKVNMDRNSPDALREAGPEQSLDATRQWIEACSDFRNVRPILTPRFIPSCSNALLEGLSMLQRDYGLPVQSHLSENLSEIAWVKELCPGVSCYGEAYDRFGLFGGSCPTVMAHCVHPEPAELTLMQKRGVFIAHCPQSNENLASGIAPARAYLDAGMPMGLGTDMAGGFSLSMLRAMADAVQVSKLRWRLVDETKKPLSVSEAFYLATRGGGAFFGKVGAFEQGYEFDAVVFDDARLPHPQALTPLERLERLIFLSDGREVCEKYVAGIKI